MCTHTQLQRGLKRTRKKCLTLRKLLSFFSSYYAFNSAKPPNEQKNQKEENSEEIHNNSSYGKAKNFLVDAKSQVYAKQSTYTLLQLLFNSSNNTLLYIYI